MEVGTYQAKTHLPRLLEQVLKGERITITRHGVPIAVLAPVEPVRKVDVRETIRELKEFGKGQTTGGLGIRALLEEGRR
jgi:prevent-host-death family protein